MKQLFFLQQTTLDNKTLYVGECLNYTTEFNSNTNAKNRNYIDEALVERMIEFKAVVSYDPDKYYDERHTIMAAHANGLETLSYQFCEGHISDEQLLQAQIRTAIVALQELDAISAKQLIEKDQIDKLVKEAYNRIRQ
jgi:hypothetical protein